MVSRYVVCLTAVGSRPVAERIARRLVERRLAACVNILPGAVSFYPWKGNLCRDREVLLLLKTVRSRLTALERALHRLHPYELPEFVVLPIVRGSRPYLKWLESVTAKKGVSLSGLRCRIDRSRRVP